MIVRRGSAPAKVALAVALLLGPAVKSQPVAEGAPAAPTFGSTIDRFAAYVGQTTCDPTAKPGALALRDLLERTYPATTPFGIGRDCAVGGQSEHKEGRAHDWGVNAYDPTQKAMAEDLLTWLLATDRHGNVNAMARRLGLMYVIWNSRIWKSYGTNRGWQPYSGSSPHTDHVHFSMSWDGAYARTSWYTTSPLPPMTIPGGNGVASSPDAAAVRGSARADFVVKGTDGLVYLNTWNGSSWSGYRGLGAPTRSGIRGDPAVVSWAPGRLDVFVRGVDDKLWQRFSTNGGDSWSGWSKPVGDQGILASGPDVAAWASNRIDVFVRGTDGQLYQRTWDGASWGGSWLARGGFLSGDPTVVSWGTGRLDVFARGGDGKLWQTFTDSSAWSGWFRPGGTEPGNLAAPDGNGSGVVDAASWGRGHVSVFVRSTDSQVWETRYQDGWSAWARSAPGDIVRGGPGATSRGDGRLDVFVRAADGSTHQYLPR